MPNFSPTMAEASPPVGLSAHGFGIAMKAADRKARGYSQPEDLSGYEH